MKSAVVIGSINMDYVINVQKMPLIGETLLCDSFEIVPGGKGANQAYALGKLGGNVAMLGAVGEDSAGQVLMQNLKAAGVDTSYIKRVQDKNTGTAFICVDKEGKNNIIVAQGANNAVDIPYIDANLDLLKACDLVVLQLEIPLETVVYAAKTARSLGKTVILDPAPARRDIPQELYQCVDYIKPNEVEVCTLVDSEYAGDRLESATALLQDWGVKNVIVTLGGKGAFLRDEQGNTVHFPADSTVHVVDTTAAGDGFTAALAYGLCADMELKKAMELAISVSNIIVTRKGAQTSIPRMDEVMAFAASRQKRTAALS